MNEANRTDKGTQTQQFVELATTIVAPITLVTAFLVYFGWIRGKSYYGYFGINQGVLGLSVQDYVLRSTDVTLGAVLRLLTAGVVLVVLDRLIVTWSKRQRADEEKRWLRASLAVCGLALIALGLLLALGIAGGVSVPPLFGAASLGVGAVLVLRLGSTLLHHRVPSPEHSPIAGRVTAIAVLVLAAFWASTLYAQDLGQQTARAVDASPGRLLPLVTVFSKEYLDLPGSHVRASEISRQGGTYYRYKGLYLLTYSNDRWFLITGRYSDGHRSSVVTLHDSEGIRVEVTRPATGHTAVSMSRFSTKWAF